MEIEIDIGSNNFADLNAEQTKRVKPTKRLNLETSFAYNNNLYEIDSTDIPMIAQSNHLVWVHIWRPFCGDKSCQFIAPFQTKADANNIKLFMVSETYDFKSLDSIAHRASFSYPFFVVRGNTFGHKIDKSRKLFLQSLAQDQSLQPTKYASDFLYKKGTLIYAGDNLIDSLPLVLNRN